MKKIISISLVVLFIAVGISCRKAKKNVYDYLPKVKTASAVLQSDGTVLVTGEIESEGEAAIENVGFCCGTTNNPEITTRQKQVSLNGTSFTAVYEGLSGDSTYYFRTWATNKYGYTTGNSIALSNISSAPVVPTCTLTLNSLNIGSGPNDTYFNVTNPTQSGGKWLFTGNGSSTTVNFTFASAISTGVYQTSTNTSSGGKYVSVSFVSGFISGTLNAGTNVYVNTISPGVYDISICSAPWVYSSSTLYFNTRIKVPS